MKKLMLAAVALASGVAMAIESANVVGYQNKGITEGEYNMHCSTFLPVGKAATAAVLGDFTANLEFGFGSGNVMTLTPNGGRTGSVYTYLTTEEAEEYGIEGLTAGWYDYNYVNEEWSWQEPIPAEKCGNNMSLPYGTMFIVQAADGAQITYNGQVLSENYSFAINEGEYNMLGNATPVDLTLGDFTTNLEFGFGSGNVMTLTPNGGRTGSVYTYLTAEEAEEYGIEGLLPGWYDYNYVNDEWSWQEPIPEEKCGNSLPIPAGYGFVVQAADGAVLELPKAL
jgi:hypothetical protein